MYINLYSQITVHTSDMAFIKYGNNLHIMAYVSEKLYLLFTMLLLYMCQQQIYPSNATYIPYMQISSGADMIQLCQYICFT